MMMCDCSIIRVIYHHLLIFVIIIISFLFDINVVSAAVLQFLLVVVTRGPFLTIWKQLAFEAWIQKFSKETGTCWSVSCEFLFIISYVFQQWNLVLSKITFYIFEMLHITLCCLLYIPLWITEFSDLFWDDLIFLFHLVLYCTNGKLVTGPCPLVVLVPRTDFRQNWMWYVVHQPSFILWKRPIYSSLPRLTPSLGDFWF